MNVESIQKYLQEHKIDGWLLYDFQGMNPIALHMLRREGMLVTRRWFYLIPAEGAPVALVHKIEEQHFKGLPGRMRTFTSWQSMEKGIKDLMKGRVRVAMEYSPRCAIPAISRVDAGTVELVRAAGCTVVSSADMVQYFTSRWSAEELRSHKEAAGLLAGILHEAFGEIGRRIASGEPVDEYGIQSFITSRYEGAGLQSDYGPIVAVNQNSGNPHYTPSREQSHPIGPGDFVLVDLWAKKIEEPSVFADMTWVGYVGESVPEKFREIFDIVCGARDEALGLVQRSIHEGRVLHGWEVDDVARNYIARTGYGPFFIHRTGHSIGFQNQSTGVNMDNLESRDERELIEGVGFSIEPGIYLKEFGVRSELNVYIGKGEAICTTEVQKEIVAIGRTL